MLDVVYRVISFLVDLLYGIDIGFFSKQQFQDAVDSYRQTRNVQKDSEKNKLLPPRALGQMALDPRWEQDPDNPDQFYFNHTQNVTRQQDEYWQHYNTRVQSSTCTVQQMIESLQQLNKELPISTEMLAFRNSPSLLYASNQKQRKLRKLRHEVDITRRFNQYKQQLYNQKQFLYRGVQTDQLKPIQAKTRQIQEKIHILRDIDEIQEMYDEACLEAIQVEQEQRMLLQKTKDDQEKEKEVLRRLTTQYINAPLIKDEDYREINKQVFHEYDDDPIHMALHELDDRDGRETQDIKPAFIDYETTIASKYPKLKVHSKRTEQDRERRRMLFLSSPHNVKEMEKEAWGIEVDRISTMLATVVPKV
jgi:hypothetical protein